MFKDDVLAAGDWADMPSNEFLVSAPSREDAKREACQYQGLNASRHVLFGNVLFVEPFGRPWLEEEIDHLDTFSGQLLVREFEARGIRIDAALAAPE